jgi:hypothetical protein
MRDASDSIREMEKLEEIRENEKSKQVSRIEGSEI